MNTSLNLIAALGRQRQIGKKDTGLLWRLPDDMRRFKEVTMGHPVIMGRKTWESIPAKFRPLPGRTNIVVTRSPDYAAEGATVVHSVEEARAAAARAEGANEIFVIGGAELYTQMLPFADRLYLTLVEDNTEGDVYFPPYESGFELVSEAPGEGIPPHRFTLFERRATV